MSSVHLGTRDRLVALRQGRRVVVNYQTKDGKLILTSLKIRK